MQCELYIESKHEQIFLAACKEFQQIKITHIVDSDQTGYKHAVLEIWDNDKNAMAFMFCLGRRFEQLLILQLCGQ